MDSTPALDEFGADLLAPHVESNVSFSTKIVERLAIALWWRTERVGLRFQCAVYLITPCIGELFVAEVDKEGGQR